MHRHEMQAVVVLPSSFAFGHQTRFHSGHGIRLFEKLRVAERSCKISTHRERARSSQDLRLALEWSVVLYAREPPCRTEDEHLALVYLLKALV